MNQILFTGKEKKPANIKNIIKVFSIMLIIFAVIVIISVVYKVMSNNKIPDGNNIINNGLKPVAEIDKSEDSKTVIIKVNHDKNIMRIAYNWNEEEREIIEIGNKTTVTEVISLPIGNNTLYVKIIDEFGVEASYQKQFKISEEGEEITGDNDPKITILAADKSGKIKVTVEDDKELKEVFYNWNGEGEKKAQIESSTKNVEFYVEIPVGENTITVIAKDSSGNETKREEKFLGYSVPKINVIQDGNNIIMKASDLENIIRLEYTINGWTKRNNYAVNVNEVEANYEMKESGYYRVTVTVTNAKEVKSVFEGQLLFEKEN